jgi:hypothetical protein
LAILDATVVAARVADAKLDGDSLEALPLNP